MTNFEKWKSELTSDKTAEIFSDYVITCENCPAYLNCDEVEYCKDVFMKWADKEINE